jgi:CRP/FNR family transcriptional regulator
MTREDLGDYLGLTTETVSRTMTQLKTKGVIRLENDNHVRLIDMEKIIEMAEGF